MEQELVLRVEDIKKKYRLGFLCKKEKSLVFWE